MIALVLAFLVNYPNVKMQGERVDAHAKSALMMASVLLRPAFYRHYERFWYVKGYGPRLGGYYS